MSNSELKNSISIKIYNQTKKTLKGIIAQKESDLYEANNRINDLLDTIKLKEDQLEYVENEYGRTIKQKEKIIEDMAEQLTTPIHNKEWVIKYFEERCK